jgi:hypothetical protein
VKKPNRIDGLGRTGARNRQISGAGIGLRTRHIDQVLMERPPVPWFELLADNHLAAGGLIPAQIEALRESYPLTLHCIGMNLAGTDPLDLDYVARVGDPATAATLPGSPITSASPPWTGATTTTCCQFRTRRSHWPW